MKNYNKAFGKEHEEFLSQGMTEEQIEAFYPLWLEQYRSDSRYKKHKRTFVNENSNGCYAFRWGAQRKEKGAGQKTTDWSSIKLHICTFAAPPDEPQFDETILDTFGDEELQEKLRRLSPIIQLTIVLLSQGSKKKDIAQNEHISPAAITPRIKKIQEVFEDYAKKYHLITT